MIAKVLAQIVGGLNTHLGFLYPGSSITAQLKSVGKTSLQVPSNGIDVTLINVEEDKVYKNHLHALPTRADQTSNMNPLGGISKMRVNLYVLFAFYSAEETELHYINTLTRLTHVLQYFQSNQCQKITIPVSPSNLVEKVFNLEINYHNISLEDSNNMWSNLGGEQMPYAMYQIKMLELEPATTPDPVAVIQHPRISNPTYNGAGEIIYDPATNNPAGDDNQIQHK